MTKFYDKWLIIPFFFFFFQVQYNRIGHDKNVRLSLYVLFSHGFRAVGVIASEFYTYPCCTKRQGTVDSRGRNITTVINPEARLAAFNYR